VVSAVVSRHPHPVVLGAPRHLAPGPAPLLLQREDEDFVAAVVQDLAAAEGHARLLATRAQARAAAGTQRLKLFQPMQRRFHLALVEAWCDVPGRPRIDPARVAAAGLVVRRLRNGKAEGWMRAQGRVRGWLPVERLGGEGADPAPATRLATRDTGVARIDRALRQLRAAEDASVLEEDIVPMFAAPPDVCARTGQTVYYGVVPTTSSERAETGQDVAALFAGFDAGSAAFLGHLVQPLRGLYSALPSPPSSDRRFGSGWYTALKDSAQDSAPRRFLDLLQQLAGEFDAFGQDPASRELRAQLAAIRLDYLVRPGETSPRGTDAASFLEAAAHVLLDEQPGQVEMPVSWPALGSAQARRLREALHGAMLARFRQVSGRPGRFDDPGAEYEVRAFLRLKSDCGCPERTVWSEPTERFVIAPWYEGAGDPVRIDLPNLKDRQQLKALKPNVAFALPADLQNLLAGDPSRLLDGEKGGGGFTVGWICSFSIPVITFCAFIVLNIFLSLFDLFFRWMMFIKICIPYPKKTG